jgi:hypothetical protein
MASRADLHCHSNSATPPEALYALAKRRGMDFVTITDHDSIDAVLAIADHDDVFMSVELTARFRDAPEAVRVLCYGVSTFDHAWLQRRRDDVEVCAAYLHEHSIACALVDPLDPALTPWQRRRLAQLFPWCGKRACGAAVGTTYTETPPAATPWEFLAYLRGGHAVERGVAEFRAA